MKSTVKVVGIVVMITLFSRLLALVGTSVYMTHFGTDNPFINIYAFALNFPNIVFTVLGTALVTVVIPIFSGLLAKKEELRAYRYADNILSLSLLATIVLSVAGILIAPLIVGLANFKPGEYGFAVTALRIMFPVMVFYALNYMLQGLLQSFGHFSMPAMVSIPSSLVVIGYVLLLGDRFGVTGLLIATFAGLALQGLILIPPVFRTPYRYRPSFGLRDADVREALKLVPPVIIGTSAYQVNMLFNLTVAATFFLNSVAIMSMVQNLILSAVLAVIYSITSVIFPKLSMLAATGEKTAFNDQLIRVLRSILYVIFPIAVGFILVRLQLLSLLIGWKKITPENISLAGGILGVYAAGVAGIAVKEVVDRAFYALNDTLKPALNGVVVMLVNIGASLLLIHHGGAFGISGEYRVLAIPLAYSLSAVTGGIVILSLMQRKIGSFGLKHIVRPFFKVLIACGAMAVVVIQINWILGGLSLPWILADRVVKLLVPAAVGAAVYAAITYGLRMEESVGTMEKIKAKLGWKT